MLAIFSVLCAVFAVAVADRNANYWHAAQFYLAYQLEFLAFPDDPNSRLIASGCRGSMPDGSCNLEEFLRHLQIRSGPVNINIRKPEFVVGNSKFPKAEQLVQDMYNNMEFGEKKKNSVMHDFRLIWPRMTDWDLNAHGNSQPDFRQQLNNFTDNVQQLRRILGERFPSEVLNELREAATKTLVIRAASVAETNLRQMRQYLPSDMPLYTRTYQAPYSSYEDIDWDQMSRRYGTSWLDEFKGYLKTIEDEDIPKERKERNSKQVDIWNIQSHVGVLRSITHSMNRLYGDPDCMK